MTDDRQPTPAPEAPSPTTPVAAPADARAAMPVHAPRTEVTPRRRRTSVGAAAAPARRGRRGRRLEGRTATSYPLRDEARRTVGYLRLIVGQAHIPDAATVAVDVDRITIEWDD